MTLDSVVDSLMSHGSLVSGTSWPYWCRAPPLFCWLASLAMHAPGARLVSPCGLLLPRALGGFLCEPGAKPETRDLDLGRRAAVRLFAVADADLRLRTVRARTNMGVRDGKPAGCGVTW